jgi:hypothetical protein
VPIVGHPGLRRQIVVLESGLSGSVYIDFEKFAKFSLSASSAKRYE